jgi:UDP-N-acetylglucosamine acyltransferase
VPVHATALVGPEVGLSDGVEVGPFCVLTGRVRVGSGSRLETGVVLGPAPMDDKYRGEPTWVDVGSGNVFHEHATVHRSVGEGTSTVIGNGNRVMAYVHVAHNCRVGDRCVLTNGVQLAGHVEVGDGTVIGGLTGVHQFCRVGELAMVGACSYVNKDIPPFVLAAGRPCRVRGLNSVGLLRAGAGPDELALLRRAWRMIYRSDLNLVQASGRIEAELLPEARGDGRRRLETLLGFFGRTRRGIELRTGPACKEEM